MLLDTFKLGDPINIIWCDVCTYLGSKNLQEIDELKLVTVHTRGFFLCVEEQGVIEVVKVSASRHIEDVEYVDITILPTSLILQVDDHE